MYLRPGNLLKRFEIERAINRQTPEGRSIKGFEIIDDMRGVLASATPRETEAWKQRQHPISHTVVQAGPPKAKEGDRLIYLNHVYYIQGVDNIAELALYTIYYVEERADRNG